MTDLPLDLQRLLDEGMAAHRAGDLASAEQRYRLILASHPAYFAARYVLGLVHLQRNEFALAAETLAKALSINPAEAGGHVNHGLALFHLGRFDEALAACDRALALNAVLFLGHATRGRALLGLGRAREAITALDRALALDARKAEVWHARACAALSLGRSSDALAGFERVLALDPQHVEALSLRGFVLESLRRYDEAAASYDRAYAIRPDEAFLEGARLHARMHVCDWRNFGTDCKTLLDHLDQERPSAAPFALLALPSSGRQQRVAAENFVRLRLPPFPPPLWNGERYSHDRTRVAYISASFVQHPVALLSVGIFEAHDRAQFEIWGLSLAADDGSDIRNRLGKAFDHFIDATGKNDVEIAQLLRRNEIDIAVDLDGYTTNARTEIFAHRAAPVQVTYLGYPGTLGSPYMDYILGDAVVMPRGAEQDFSEKIIRLPGSYLPNSARPPLASPPSRASCGLPESGMVFCCFNNSFKLTPDAFAIWMRLLLKVDGSVLWLRDGGPQLRVNLLREAGAQGIAADRLVFAGHTASHEDHFNRHQLADIFLDTLYYNAHTTASDALWAGVPVVTCTGPAFAGRVGASLLAAAGLSELVTHSLQDYEALALRLAQEPAFLASVKTRLSQARETALLFDVRRTTLHIEQAMRVMRLRVQSGRPPESFDVTPLA